MAANPGQTYGIAGKRGEILIGGQTAGLHLTKFTIRGKTDSAETTNNRSPVMKINGQLMLAAEYIPTVFDGEVEFEGIYTIQESSTPTYTGLMFSSGTILPGFGSAGPQGGLYTFLLYPDDVSSVAAVAASAIAGNVNIEAFELTGEVRGDETFKGNGKFSGGFVDATSLSGIAAASHDFTSTSNKL